MAIFDRDYGWVVVAAVNTVVAGGTVQPFGQTLAAQVFFKALIAALDKLAALKWTSGDDQVLTVPTVQPSVLICNYLATAFAFEVDDLKLVS